MDIKKVGSRGFIFSFNDLGIATNVYVINGKDQVYIIDTYLGPDVMELINEYIRTSFGNKRFIVVNSHSHWDHVWGNSLYSSDIIISHVFCKDYMEKDGMEALEKYKKYRKGEIILTYPNLTFTDKIYFEEDEILIYHTPGHSEDEISIIDLREKILFVGDNLERPIPYLMAKDLKQYIRTLESYLELEVEIIIGGHTGLEDKSLVLHNLDYVKRVLAGEVEDFEKGEYEDYHKTNMEWLKNNGFI